MSTLIRTDQVPAADLIDFLQEIMATMWLPMDCRPESRWDYCAEFRASGLGPMQVVVMDVPPATVRRTPALICKADPDMLKITLVRLGENLRNACVNDRIAQFRLEDDALVVSDEISFDLVTGPFHESLDVIDAKPIQTTDSSFLKEKVGSPPLVIPIRITRDTILAVRKGPREQRTDFGMCFGLDLSALSFKILERFVSEAIEIRLVDKRAVDSAIAISIDERFGRREGSNDVRLQGSVIRMYGRPVQRALFCRIQ